MTDKNLRPKVGILGLTLELYETMAPGLREDREQWVRERVVPALSSWAEVSFPRAVYRRRDIEATVSEFEAQGMDALVVMLLTYSPSQLSLPALNATRLPIMVWNTQELFAAGEGLRGADMLNNHGVHGTQDLCNVLLRSDVKFSYLTSHLTDKNSTRGLADFFAAAAAVRRLRSARIGLLGFPFPGMGDFALDTTQLAATLGCGWIPLSVSDFLRRAKQAESADLERLVADYRGSYDVAPDVTDAELLEAARMEVAMRSMVDGNELAGLTYQFMAFAMDDPTATVPFVAASRLMSEGIGFGGEGDIIAAAGTTFLNWLSPPASFSEIFTVDFEGNGVILSHMGEANVAMARADRKAPLVARGQQTAGTQVRQLAVVTSFEPGPATMAALTLGRGGQWKLIASRVTIADYGPLNTLGSPHSKLVPEGDVRDFLTGYATSGGPHHLAICFGDARPRLKLAAHLIGAEYCEV